MEKVMHSQHRALAAVDPMSWTSIQQAAFPDSGRQLPRTATRLAKDRKGVEEKCADDYLLIPVHAEVWAVQFAPKDIKDDSGITIDEVMKVMEPAVKKCKTTPVVHWRRHLRRVRPWQERRKASRRGWRIQSA
eukprot:2053306-Amphidinium_carterae.1